MVPPSLKQVAVNVPGAEHARVQLYPAVPAMVKSVRVELAAELPGVGTTNDVAPFAPNGSSTIVS